MGQNFEDVDIHFEFGSSHGYAPFEFIFVGLIYIIYGFSVRFFVLFRLRACFLDFLEDGYAVLEGCYQVVCYDVLDFGW